MVYDVATRIDILKLAVAFSIFIIIYKQQSMLCLP